MTDRRSSRLYISNLTPSCSQSDLKALFEKVGAVTSLSLSGDIAYLEFENPEHATTAIEKFDNYKFEGTRILVEFALKTRNFHRGRGGRSDRERDMAAGRCFKCNEKGHIAKYCFKLISIGLKKIIVLGPNNSKSNSRSRSKGKKKHRRKSSSSISKSYSNSKSVSSRSSHSSSPKRKQKNKSKRKSSSRSSSREKDRKRDKHRKKEHRRKHS